MVVWFALFLYCLFLFKLFFCLFYSRSSLFTPHSHSVEKDVFSFSFDVVANIPGSYSSNASSVYLYYTPHWQWYVPGLTIKIEPKVFKAIQRSEVKPTEEGEIVSESAPSSNDVKVEEIASENAEESPALPAEIDATPLDYYANGASINEYYGGVDLSEVYGARAGYEVPREAEDDLAAFYGGASRQVSFDFIC
jgi:hypothetical protein